MIYVVRALAAVEISNDIEAVADALSDIEINQGANKATALSDEEILQSVVTSASFTALDTGSTAEEVRASIAQDRLARALGSSGLTAAQLAGVGFAPSLLTTLMADPSILSYLVQTFSTNDSIMGSFAG